MDDKNGALEKLKAAMDEAERVDMSSVKIGDIIYVPLDEEDGLILKNGYDDRKKYIVIIGFTPEGVAIGALLINSEIDSSKRSEELLNCQYPLLVRNYRSILDYDSWLDCSDIFELSKLKITEKDGKLVESEKRTGHWAWKHTHQADGSVDYIDMKGEVVFENVNFGYDPKKIVLHDVSLYAKPGQKIAFVGSTGAGKTTITNLINRFYDIQEGKIRYDGINIGKICKDDLRHSLGIVLQDTHLFTGTVAENIRFGKLDATDEEVVAAAKLANADGFIRRLPDGYDTVLHGDGANLSQGQRQLLAIARAAIADPPVLILDEATSSIDTRTERIVQDGMDKLMSGRTSFVIAHRLSTVRNADCIMVLEQGRIIERGTHDQLIEQKGRYYQLYTGNAIGE